MEYGKGAVFIHDVSLLCALGRTQGQILANLCPGSREGMKNRSDLYGQRPLLFGSVPGALPALKGAPLGQRSRANRLLMAALSGLGDSLSTFLQRHKKSRIAVVLGTSTSGLLEGEKAIVARSATGDFPDGFHYHQQEIGSGAEFLASHLGLTGPALTISTACSSGAKAIISARSLLQMGLCDGAIVGGVDVLSRMTVEGFGALGALSHGSSNPFGADRDGINLGEGAALLLMSREPAPGARRGGGESQDAYHFSAPDPTGQGAKKSVLAALLDARLKPDDISYVNLHGTGTQQNDAMESRFMAEVFGDVTPCSSSKPLTGHTLGVSGAIELGFCWMILNQNEGVRSLPPHIGRGVYDPALPAIGLTAPGATFTLREGTAFMSNSFGFGGSNASVIIARC